MLKAIKISLITTLGFFVSFYSDAATKHEKTSVAAAIENLVQKFKDGELENRVGLDGREWSHACFWDDYRLADELNRSLTTLQELFADKGFVESLSSDAKRLTAILFEKGRKNPAEVRAMREIDALAYQALARNPGDNKKIESALHSFRTQTQLSQETDISFNTLGRYLKNQRFLDNLSPEARGCLEPLLAGKAEEQIKDDPTQIKRIRSEIDAAATNAKAKSATWESLMVFESVTSLGKHLGVSVPTLSKRLRNSNFMSSLSEDSRDLISMDHKQFAILQINLIAKSGTSDPSMLTSLLTITSLAKKLGVGEKRLRDWMSDRDFRKRIKVENCEWIQKYSPEE